MELIDDEGNHWELTKCNGKNFTIIHKPGEELYKLTNGVGDGSKDNPFQVKYDAINIGNRYYSFKPKLESASFRVVYMSSKESW